MNDSVCQHLFVEQDKSLTSDPSTLEELKQGLRSIPSASVVCNIRNLFGDGTSGYRLLMIRFATLLIMFEANQTVLLMKQRSLS
jgi:hypothetical protein